MGEAPSATRVSRVSISESEAMANCANGVTAFQIRLGLLQNGWNVLSAHHNFAPTRLIERRRRQEFLLQRADGLFDVKRRVAPPARIYIQFPTDARDSRPHQPV